MSTRRPARGAPAAAPLQVSLFAAGEPGFDAGYSRLVRHPLDAQAWVDHAQGWVSGSDALFEALLHTRPWRQRSRYIQGAQRLEPRLTAPWNAKHGEPLTPPVLEAMRQSLSRRYAVELDSVGFNLYRDGQDSVTWHGDHLDRSIPEPVVALVSLGEPRRFLLRPRGGGASRAFLLGRGDLLVTGGTTQWTWEHAVPKVAHAGPRISLAFRHGLLGNAYAADTPASTDEH